MLGVAGLTGCAVPKVLPRSSQSDTSVLLARAKTYWTLSQANDQVATWPFEDVSLDSRWTMQSYLQRGAASYDAVDVKDTATIDGEAAEVDVDITFSLPALKIKKHKMAIKDRWRLINGQWYHVLQPDSIFRQR